ncbi:MAG TPA: GNAT family N-acetyltransferase [Terriglobales bacterium]|nr:GNAT family N-acetyltransferase [Terriglobales bacterium]
MSAASLKAPLWEGSSRPPLVIEGPGRGRWAALERDWKRLQREARPANPFLSWEWQSAWAACHPAGARPLVVAETFPDGTLAGLVALQRVRRRGLAQVEFLGQGSGGDELDCLLHPAAPAAVGSRLLAAALARGRWSVLRLQSARRGGALAAAVAGGRGREEAGEWLPSLALPASFEQLLGAHSANFRAEVRRRRRAWARRAPLAALECATTPSAVAAALEQVFRLHNQRRAQRRGRGIFESPALRAFHLRAATQLAAASATRIYLLRTPTAVLAALYGFEAGDRFLYFQSGFDPAWSDASPGTVLLSLVIEDCIARGLRHFEFLRGEERYKGRWTTERRQSATLLLGRGPLGRGYLRLRQWRARWRAPAPARRAPESKRGD